MLTWHARDLGGGRQSIPRVPFVGLVAARAANTGVNESVLASARGQKGALVRVSWCGMGSTSGSRRVESVRGAGQGKKYVERALAGRAPLCPLSRWAVGVNVRRSEGHGKVPHFLICTPLGPQRGLKRHDLEKYNVRRSISRWGGRKGGKRLFFTYPRPTGATTKCAGVPRQPGRSDRAAAQALAART